jgi:hypothetical protein
MAAEIEALFSWIDHAAVVYDRLRLRNALAELRNDPRFSSARDQLDRKLRGGLSGYDSARRALTRRFLDTVERSSNAVAVFNQKVAIRDPTVKTVPRVGITDRLVKWWRDQTRPKRGAVLGEEGTGKTWALMSWLADRIDTGEMPFVLPFSAAAESISANETIGTLVLKLLTTWAGAGTVEFWAGRLNRWLAEPSSTCLLFVVADGLNERPTLPWPSSLRSTMNGGSATWRCSRQIVPATGTLTVRRPGWTALHLL